MGVAVSTLVGVDMDWVAPVAWPLAQPTSARQMPAMSGNHTRLIAYHPPLLFLSQTCAN
jgi:hypothetical protein